MGGGLPSIASDIVHETQGELPVQALNRGLNQAFTRAQAHGEIQFQYFELSIASVLPDVIGAHGEVSYRIPGIVSLQPIFSAELDVARSLSLRYEFPIAIRKVAPNGYHYWAIFKAGKNVTRENLKS